MGWVIKSQLFDQETGKTLGSILDTVISPELVPADEQGLIQSTEDKIGPYDLHVFFLYYITRFGLKPSKVAYLAYNSWHASELGAWPAHFPERKNRVLFLSTIKTWLEVFLFRFFTISQFKRSASGSQAVHDPHRARPVEEEHCVAGLL